MNSITVVLWVVAVFFVVLQLFRGWSPRVLAAPSRLTMITTTVDAVVALAVVRAFAPPPGLFSLGWTLAAVAVGFGIAGGLNRWTGLPWAKPKRSEPVQADRSGPAAQGAGLRTRTRLRQALTGIYLLVGVAVVAILA